MTNVESKVASLGDRMKDQYAETLVPLAMRLVGAVRDEGPETVHAILHAVRTRPAPEGVDPIEALAIVLAAAVDPEKPASELLGWTENIESPGPTRTDIDAEGVRGIMVDLAVDGHLKAASLTEEECREAVVLLMANGWGHAQIADLLECDRALVHKWANREYTRRSRERARNQKATSAAA